MKDQIGLALIGCGRAGMIHARNFAGRVPGATMVAVSDVDAEQAHKAARETGAAFSCTDWRELLERPEVDAVIIVTPTKFHEEIAVAAAAAGKHIFCEKPMAMTVEECDRMNEAVKRAGVCLQIGFMRRFDKNFKRAKEIIDAGDIGDVVMVKSLTRGPSTPREWMYDIGKSNGPLAEVNSHDIDTLRWFTGSDAAELWAIAGNYRCPDARAQYPDFYDTVLMNVRMQNGMLGGIDGAQGVQYGYDARVDILGTHGSVQLGGLPDKTTMSYTKDGRLHGDIVRSWTTLFEDAYLAEDIAFANCVREGRPPEVTGEDGRQAVAIVRAGNLSISTGQLVTL